MFSFNCIANCVHVGIAFSGHLPKGVMHSSMSDFNILSSINIEGHSPTPSKVTEVLWHPPLLWKLNVMTTKGI